MSKPSILEINSNDRLSGSSDNFVVGIAGGHDSLLNVSHLEVKAVNLPQSINNIHSLNNQLHVGFDEWNLGTDTFVTSRTTPVSIPNIGFYSRAELIPLLKTAIEGCLAVIFPSEVEPFTVDVTFNTNNSKFTVDVTSVYGKSHDYGSGIVQHFVIYDKVKDTSLYTNFSHTLNFLMGYHALTYPTTTIIPFEDATNKYTSSHYHAINGGTILYIMCDQVGDSVSTNSGNGRQILTVIPLVQNYGEILALTASSAESLVKTVHPSIQRMRFTFLDEFFLPVDLNNSTVTITLKIHYRDD